MTGPPRAYEFGPFCLEVDRRVLLRDGVPVALAPKALETLLALIEHRDRVLTKDELLQLIWGDTVVEEGGLSRNISILRKALGEKPDDHQYIVTIPGRGYRFVADVVDADEHPEAAVAPDDQVPVVAVAAAGPRGRWSSSHRVMLGVALLAASAAAVYALRPHQSLDPRRPPITALAVLPLDNLSGDPSQEYFADGMTEALIGSLARIRALRVVSRTSVMRFKGATQSLPEIARLLNVDAVIEGSVQRTGDRVRISVQLVHAPSDTHLWAREYERTLTDILTLQAEVAGAVAEEIHVQVTAEERASLAAAGPVNPAAYQEYLLGQHYLWRLSEEDLARAIDHFEHAARLDPEYAAAYAGLSHAWWWRGVWGAKTFKEVESASRAAAAKALALDPRGSDALVSSGRIKFGYDRDWSGAQKDFARAREIDPNNVDAHVFSATLCMAVGCFEESIAHMRRAEQLDPLSPTVQSFFGRVLYRARQFDEAIAHLNRAIELAPHGSAGTYRRLADVYEEIGRYDEALALLDKAALVNREPAVELSRARVYARMGKHTDARAILDASRGRSPQAAAMVHVALGDTDEAFRLLFKEIAEPHDLDVYVKTDPRFDRLHADPRWLALLRRMNLPADGEISAVTPQP